MGSRRTPCRRSPLPARGCRRPAAPRRRRRRGRRRTPAAEAAPGGHRIPSRTGRDRSGRRSRRRRTDSTQPPSSHEEQLGRSDAQEHVVPPAVVQVRKALPTLQGMITTAASRGAASLPHRRASRRRLRRRGRARWSLGRLRWHRSGPRCPPPSIHTPRSPRRPHPRRRSSQAAPVHAHGPQRGTCRPAVKEQARDLGESATRGKMNELPRASC